MTDPLAQLAGLGTDGLTAAGLVFVRVGAVLAMLPAFGEQSVPVRVRLAVAIAFTAIAFPAVAPGVLAALDAAPLARAVAGEAVAGLALGFLIRLLVFALQTAGTIAANMTSLSQILGGAGVDPQPAISHLLVIAGLALATMNDLHVKAAAAIILSYEAIPAAVPVDLSALAAHGVERTAAAFGLAFSLAAPFTIAAMLYNLALGAINKAMPQLMVAFVGAPAITGGALALLFLCAPLLLSVWVAALDRTLAAPFGAR